MHPRYPFDRPSSQLPAPLAALIGQPATRVSLWNGQSAWLVTSHRTAKAILGDRVFSSDVTLPGYPLLTPGRALLDRPTLLRMDDPDHARLRRMLIAHFTARRIRALAPQVHLLAGRLLDELAAAGPPADFAAGLAVPLPAQTICAMLGVPTADLDLFATATQTLGSHAASAEDRQAAAADLLAYLDRFIADQVHRPGPGIIGDLIRDEVRPGRLQSEQLADTARLLLTAGQETATGMIALSLVTLATRPTLAERLRTRPGELPGAVEELLRLHSVIHTGVTRVAAADTTVDGIDFRVGDGVIVSLAAANQDPAEHERPGELDPARRPTHLAFGAGPHQCLGQSLARAQLTAVLTAVLRRFKTLRLARPATELDYTGDAGVLTVTRLPLTW